jgi:hypothetical protein
MVVGDPTQGGAGAGERPLPPLGAIVVASMTFIILGGIYIASYVPRAVPLTPAVVLLAGAVVLLAADLVVLSRLGHFAWQRFFQVFRWALLAYAVIAGMIGYVFVVDGTRGRLLIILISMLLIYAVDIPLLLAFSVARYEDVTTA